MSEWRSRSRLFRSVFASNFKLPRHPLKLTLALTERCSMECSNCGIWKQANPAEPTLDEIDCFFSRNRGFAWVDLTGGEIFERLDVDQIFGSIYRHCDRLYLLHFPTNGWWPHRVVQAVTIARKIRSVRLIVTVSIDGPSDLHDELKGRTGSFQRAVETIRRLRDIPGVDVFAGMTLGRSNVNAADETIRALALELPGFGPRDLHINFVNQSAHYFHNVGYDTADRESLSAAVAGFRRLRGFPTSPELLLEHMYLGRVPRFLATGRTPLFCQSLSNNCFVAADWTLYPCTIWDRPLADLRAIDFDLGRVWREPPVVEARSLIASRDCPNCWTPCEAYPSILGRGRGIGKGVTL